MRHHECHHIILIVKLLCFSIVSILSISASASNSQYINPISLGLRSAIAKSSNSVGYFGDGGSISLANTFVTRRRKNRTGGFNFNQQQQQTTNIITDTRTTDEGNSNILQTSNNNGIKELQPNLPITSTTANTAASSATTNSTTKTRGGGKAKAIPEPVYLNFWENMVCGAVSRAIAQTATHPANTMKTLLQSNRDSATRMTLKEIAKVQNLKMLTRGAGAQTILSIPHGAVNFAVLEFVRFRMNSLAMKSEWASRKKDTSAAFGPAMDFLSSAIATVCCSVISTPQMMIVDNIMAGTYANLAGAVSGLSAEKGIAGFYTGWWPGLAGKIPSYALTWTLFQQLKQLQLQIYQRPPRDFENSIMGCMASATTVCIMIPMDTIKTRLVTQVNYPDLVPYKGIVDAAVRIFKEEGLGTFYRGLPPRLISVVPMIGIQFGVYEFMKTKMLSRRDNVSEGIAKINQKEHTIESVIMEVAADDDQPFPAPHLRDYEIESKNGKSKKKKTRQVKK